MKIGMVPSVNNMFVPQSDHLSGGHWKHSTEHPQLVKDQTVN